MQHIDVVAGIIHNPDRSKVLLSLRKPHQHQGDLWEFPGGKQEAGESAADALVRELEEELGIVAQRFETFTTIEHRYTDKAVRLHFYSVWSFHGQPVGRENQKLFWCELSALSSHAFPEANLPVVELLGVSART